MHHVQAAIYPAQCEQMLHAAGAVRTIIQMLGTEQKRAAAVTMLGKTVERCADQVSPPWLPNPEIYREPRSQALPCCKAVHLPLSL